jgi:chitodextrinase
MGAARLAWIAAVLVAVLVPATGAQAHAGHEAEIEGTLRVRHDDDFAHGRAGFAYTLVTPDGPVQLDLAGERWSALAGKKLKIHGHLDAGVLTGADGGVTQVSSGAVTSVSGAKRVAVVLFNFSNDTSQPWTASTVRGLVFDGTGSVNAYYQDASYGAVSLTGDVFGWYTIAATDAGCAYDSWASDARARAQAAGVDLSGYGYVVYAFPSASSCGWAGLAYLPGTSSWINGAMQLRVVAHELGHNFGVHHASSLSCTSAGVRVALSASCTADEYGDPFTVMGSSSSRLHVNWHRAQLGWLTDVQTVTASGTYTLAPDELPGAPRLLRVARGDGTWFQLEFRQPAGLFDAFSALDPAVNGVSIRLAPDTSQLVQSKLLDATPETTTFTDAPLAVGRTLTDLVSGVRFTTVAVGTSGATVSIQLPGGGPDTQAPTAPGGLAATALSSSSIGLSWTASADAVGVTGYRVYRGGVQVATETGTSWTDSGLTPSTAYAYQVVAYDAALNTSPPASVTGTTLAVDAAPPSAPGTLTVSVASGRRAMLSWGAATDDVAVTGYRVLRNGIEIATTSSRSYKDRPGRGTFTYTVVAFDGAGHTGPPSNAVTVTIR